MRLVLIGGNEFAADDGIDRQLAGQAGREIGLIAAASDHPNQKYDQMARVYQQFGCGVRQINSEHDLEGIKLIYFSGGDPDKLARHLGSSLLGKSIERGYREHRFSLAGSSAGAMVLFDQMLARGSWMKGNTELTPGWGISSGVVFVPHWDKTETNWREKLVKAHHEQRILAVDENTAVEWWGLKAEVIGLGKARLLGAEDGTWTAGQHFDLKLS